MEIVILLICKLSVSCADEWASLFFSLLNGSPSLDLLARRRPRPPSTFLFIRLFLFHTIIYFD